MSRVVEAELRLKARDATAPGIRSAVRRLDEIERKAKAVNRKVAAYERAAATSRRVAAIERAERAANAAAFAATTRVLAPAAIALGASASIKAFAGVERSINRIGITADATAEDTAKAFGVIEQAAYDYAMPQGEIIAGLDTLVAAGMNLEQALGFLPAVAATAQASGSAVTDIAATADSVARNFKIAGSEAQDAFDILVTGGKAGMFELRDMAAYLPEIAPAFAALGNEGEEGLKKLVANLQVLRAGAGSAGQAATYMTNILARIESEETANKFSKMGVDLRKEMARARKEGRDLLEFFVELTNETVNGDLSKLPLLFGDMQMAAGMRTLMLNTEMLANVMRELGKAAGATRRDLDRVLTDTQAKLDRMATSWDTLKKNVGSGIATVANPAMEWINSEADEYRNVQLAIAKEEEAGGSEAEARAEYYKRFEANNPEPSKTDLDDWLAWRQRRISSFTNDAVAYGRGEIPTWYTNLDRQASDRHRPAPMTAAQAYAIADLGGYGANLDDLPEMRTGVPVPIGRDDLGASYASHAGMSQAEQYAEYGRGRRSAEKMTTPAALDRQAQADLADPFGAPSLVDITAETDALRLAMEDGAGALTLAGDDAGASLITAVQTMATLLEQAIGSAGDALATKHAAAIRSAISQAVNVKVSAPAGMSRPNADVGRSMPDVGTPGG